MDDVGKLSYELAEAFDKSDDVAFRRRMEDMIIAGRATALQQKFGKYGRFPASSENSITLPMKKVPPAECLSGDVSCEVYRTEQKIPRPLTKAENPIPFSFVGLMDQSDSFIFVRPEEVKSILKGTKFIKKKTLYAYYNDYIYTYNHADGKITIRDVFADPREILKLYDCDKKPCSVNIELDEDMKRVIKLFIFEELRALNVLPPDKQIRIDQEA